jgi:hypothetical protein
VPELEVRERPPSTLRNVDAPPGGVRAGGSKVGDVDDGPLGDAGGRSDCGHHRS